MTPETKALSRRYLDEVIESGVCSGMRVSAPEGGKFLQLLEAEYRSLFGVPYAVACNSATSGLHMALVAAQVSPGSTVLVSGISMSASGAAVHHADCHPYYIDTDPETGLVTLETIMEAYQEAKDEMIAPPSAIIIVHLFGQVFPFIPELRAAFPHMKIIEDCAQSPACVDNDARFSGTLGDVGVFSLNQHKVVQCGEGGVCVTEDKKIYERLMWVRNHGENYTSEIVGYNYRMTELEAAVAYAEVSELFARQRARHAAAAYFYNRIQSLDGMKPGVAANPPFLLYLIDMGDDLRGAPPGWRRGYASPLCCIPGLKDRAGQSCLLGAHEFNSRVLVHDPVESLEEADKVADALLGVTVG